VKFSYGGNDVNRPAELERLPLALYRSQNYPQQPGAIGYEIKRFLSGANPPIYVPTRMYYTRWSKKHDIFGANTVAMLQALNEGRQTAADLQSYATRGVPISDLHTTANARGMNPMPSLRRLSDQDYAALPGPRNGLPRSAFISPSDLITAIQLNQPVT
jgi:hypothetical protein